MTNSSDEFKSLKINKTETFEDQAKQKRRPRINFNELKKQLKYNEIFNDCFEEVFKTKK